MSWYLKRIELLNSVLIYRFIDEDISAGSRLVLVPLDRIIFIYFKGVSSTLLNTATLKQYLYQILCQHLIHFKTHKVQLLS